MGVLSNKKVAILTTHGFEESELTSPREALLEAGAEVHVVSPESGSVKGWSDGNWSNEVAVDRVLSETQASEYDALVLPGGVLNPDKLRAEDAAVDFVAHFMKQGKPVAAICHGPQTLIETDLLRGRKLTSYPSVRKDLENAGANWVNQEVVTDQGLVTSRSPADLPAFNKKMIEEIAEGKH